MLRKNIGERVEPDETVLSRPRGRAYPTYPSFVGSSADILKDADGKPLGKAPLDAGSREGGGSVEYAHINPVSHLPGSKVAFVQKAGGDVCGVGAYKPKG